MSLQEAQEAPDCGEQDGSRGTTAPKHLDVPAELCPVPVGHLAGQVTQSPMISVISALMYMRQFYINSLMT